MALNDKGDRTRMSSLDEYLNLDIKEPWDVMCDSDTLN